eukprot:scaffold4964_cov248-Ochromonas_danica.AAC.2
MLSSHCQVVNVGGTENVILACKEAGINRLIYTSTYNVVFGGHEIENGNESWPYFPLDQHTDEYSKSKAIAEQLVIQANGTSTNKGSLLHTAVIRPAAIYGEDEERHLPRIVKHLDRGLFMFTIGHAVVDWVYIDNLVQAYLLLADKLLSTRNYQEKPAGQVYCISDDCPMENFEFLRPLVEARKRNFPPYELSTHSAHCLSWLLEDIFWISSKFGFPIQPMLTRAEVFKVGVTHYFSMEKAKTELGYAPTLTSQEGGKRIAEYYKKHFHSDDYFEIASPLAYVLVLSGMGLLAFTAFRDSTIPLDGSILKQYVLSPVEALAILLFQNQVNLQRVFYAAVATHVMEGLLAYQRATNFCKNTASWWWLQTTLLGYPSFSLLLAREALLKSK